MPSAFWRLPDVMYIGTNRVLCFASLQGFKWDAVVIRDTYRNLWHRQEWGAKYHSDLWKPCNAYKVGPAGRRYTHCHEFVRQVEGWQFERVEDHNHEAAIMRNESVAIMAANLAWLWGAREIYFVGVDYGGPHAEMIEPWGSKSPGWEGQYDRLVPRHIEKQYSNMREAIESAGGKCCNLSPGSKLKSLEIKDWRDAFEAG